MNNKEVARNSDDSFVTIEGGKNELTQKMIREAIGGFEKKLLEAKEEDKVALKTFHDFAEGVYIRTVHMKAGTLITGKIHRIEHAVIVAQGKASVLSEEFGAKEISAPMVFISPAEAKRLFFIREDMIWTTVHPNPTNTRDLDELEKALILEDYEQITEGEMK